MRFPLLEIVDTGLGVSFQDDGRAGWKRFGVPPGGAMDAHARAWANILVGNPAASPLLEILLSGARFRALVRLRIALTGAAATGPGQRWQTRTLEEGETLAIPPSPAGVWTYLACEAGFEAPRWFGSVSVFPRGGLGEPLRRGDILCGRSAPGPAASTTPGARWLDPRELRDYSQPPAFRVWPGPQWDALGTGAQKAFFEGPWQVSARSDRTGYRLSGPSIAQTLADLPSEPVIPGTLQIPPDGQPIVTMRDGPTVGGYPKLGVLDPDDLARIAQCRPGQTVCFAPAT